MTLFESRERSYDRAATLFVSKKVCWCVENCCGSHAKSFANLGPLLIRMARSCWRGRILRTEHNTEPISSVICEFLSLIREKHRSDLGLNAELLQSCLLPSFLSVQRSSVTRRIVWPEHCAGLFWLFLGLLLLKSVELTTVRGPTQSCLNPVYFSSSHSIEGNS